MLFLVEYCCSLLCMLPPGVDSFMKYVDAVVLPETNGSLPHEVEQYAHDHAKGGIVKLGRAFDLGLTSCEALVDCIVPPFLKLAQKAGSCPASTASSGDGKSAAAVEKLFLRWVDSLDSMLITGFRPDGRGGWEPQIQTKKRRELKRALLKSKLPQVPSPHAHAGFGLSCCTC